MFKEQAAPIAKSRLFGAKDVDSVITIMLLSDALGIHPVAGLNNIYIIEGKPSPSVHLMTALVQDSGLLEDIQIVDDEETCTVTAKRKGITTPFVSSFSMDDARRAKLTGKNTWVNYPKDMRRARALSNVYRMGFSDVTLGLYSREEMEDVQQQPENPAQVEELRAEIVAAIEPTVDYSAVIAEFRAKVKATFPDITKGDVLDALDVDDVLDFDWSRGVDEAFSLVEQHMIEKAQGALDPEPEPPTFVPAGEPPALDADPEEFEGLPAKNKSTNNPPKSTVPRTTKDSKAEYERFLEEVAKPNGLTSADLNKAFGIPGDPYNFRTRLWNIESNWNAAKQMAEAYIQKQVSGVETAPAGAML